MNGRVGLVGGALVLAGVLLIGAGSIDGGGYSPGGMMGGYGAGMMGGYGGGMMGGYGNTGPTGPGPGESGFVAGTPAAPRVVRVIAGPGFTFSPATIRVARGETVSFEVTSVGGLLHEFMIGPSDAVAAHTEGTPGAEDIGMMQTKSVSYTFDGRGPYAFACHEPGHYEAGMRGTIEVVG
jgi:plastocyanin